MRLIDTDKLNLKEYDFNDFKHPGFPMGWNMAVERIQTAPTVDAVEVVRCKDCKHGDVFAIEDCAPFFACYKNKPNVKPVKHNWFCADGERKDDTNAD